MKPGFPHLGDSPDGLISCDCCGSGLIEIKCPYKHRNDIHNMSQILHFYLTSDETGAVSLRQGHQFYYHIQGQVAVCDREFCDFVCWTSRGMHMEPIVIDLHHLVAIKPMFIVFVTPSIGSSFTK